MTILRAPLVPKHLATAWSKNRKDPMRLLLPPSYDETKQFVVGDGHTNECQDLVMTLNKTILSSFQPTHFVELCVAGFRIHGITTSWQFFEGICTMSVELSLALDSFSPD